ncbi:hypothetical protein H5410_055672, partial [Solanum commersonii]
MFKATRLKGNLVTTAIHRGFGRRLPCHQAKQPECCTLDGESPVRSDPSSIWHVEFRVNQQ